MKITAPKSAEEYFKRTEHAVKHAYDGLASCWLHVEEARRHQKPPILKDGMLHYLPPETPEERAALEKVLGSYEKYFELKISEAMFAGAILEAAYMAIKLYSRNTSIPANCARILKPSSSAVPFCIGKERYGIPIGLIVYAGRNQYAHWDAKRLNKDNIAVFRTLAVAFWDDPLSDLAFDLSNPTINIYAGEMLFTALRWTTYDIYLAEMLDLLSETLD